MDFITENFLFLSFTVGIIYILAALITMKFPPKNINHYYGYRTVNSMKNQKRWDFAQRFSTIQMIKAGFLMITVSAFGFFIPISENINLILGLIITFAITAFMIFTIEQEIKKKFPEN